MTRMEYMYQRDDPTEGTRTLGQLWELDEKQVLLRGLHSLATDRVGIEDLILLVVKDLLGGMRSE